MAEWTTSYGPKALSTTWTSQHDRTYRVVLDGNALTASGRKVRIKFSRDNGADWYIGECWIGHNETGSATDYSFDGNQVQITFSGSDGVTVTSDGQASDAVDFDLDDTKPLVVAVYINSSNTTAIPRDTDTNVNIAYNYNEDGNEASTEDPSLPGGTGDTVALIDEIEVVEGQLVGLSFDAGIQFDHPDRAALASASVDFGVDGTRETENNLSESASVGFSADRIRETPRAVSFSESVGLATEAFNWTEWLAENRHLAVPQYYLTLTGDADGETDLEIPIKSFQMRLRTGDPSYLECVVPDVGAYLASINARINGDLKLEMAWLVDGTESVRETLVTVDLDDARTDQGPRNESITIKGSRTSTPATKTTYLQDVTYRSLNEGKLHIRTAVPDIYLQPGDTAKYETDDFSDSFTVDRITYIVAANRQQMDVVEG